MPNPTRVESPSPIVRLPWLKQRLSIGRSLIYSQVREGLLPRPISLGARAVGWIADEVDAVIAARTAGTDASGIKALVVSLIAARTLRVTK